MSSVEGGSLTDLDFGLVSDLAVEPSYISEMARKLQRGQFPMGYTVAEAADMDDFDRTWDIVSENTAVRKVAKAVYGLTEQNPEAYTIVRIGYDGDTSESMGESQSIGSSHLSFSEIGFQETSEWRDYVVLNNVSTSPDDIGTSLSDAGLTTMANVLRDMVDEEVSVDEKVDIIQTLSRSGNDLSKLAERVMQDCMERQFKNYDRVEYSDYNDPGNDFLVQDDDRRDYGLIIEVSTRWVNPIGEPYIQSKVDEAIELEEEGEETTPWDVLILAPRFTQKAIEKYEYSEEGLYHNDPDEGMVHLHRVPVTDPLIYSPFITDPSELSGSSTDGNPLIVPDNERLRSHILDYGHVGDDYPIVDSEMGEYSVSMDFVGRKHSLITESHYRNMLREAIEPLLWQFMRPYKVEQFLVQTYWDFGLTQGEAGRLIDRSGSTIGSWMRDWDVIRRGTGAPELSEETKEVWRRMYEGSDPFPQQYSGYRIQAEYNRHPLWGIDDWREWFNETTEDERQEVVASQDSHRDAISYTLMAGAKDRLQPSYTFIISTLKDMGVEIRPPDEAPRGDYNAFPSRDGLEYMLNRDEGTIVDVSE